MSTFKVNNVHRRRFTPTFLTAVIAGGEKSADTAQRAHVAAIQEAELQKATKEAHDQFVQLIKIARRSPPEIGESVPKRGVVYLTDGSDIEIRMLLGGEVSDIFRITCKDAPRPDNGGWVTAIVLRMMQGSLQAQILTLDLCDCTATERSKWFHVRPNLLRVR